MGEQRKQMDKSSNQCLFYPEGRESLVLNKLYLRTAYSKLSRSFHSIHHHAAIFNGCSTNKRDACSTLSRHKKNSADLAELSKMVLEVGVEATSEPNKDGVKNDPCIQNSTHSDLPPELEGKALDLDNLAYEVILAWDSLPIALKEAIVSIVRSHAKNSTALTSEDSEVSA